MGILIQSSGAEDIVCYSSTFFPTLLFYEIRSRASARELEMKIPTYGESSYKENEILQFFSNGSENLEILERRNYENICLNDKQL